VITDVQSARAFYDAFDSFGIDVYSPSELLAADEADRGRADGMLARGGVTVRSRHERRPRNNPCPASTERGAPPAAAVSRYAPCR